MPRTFLHVDMDAFYASVEQRDHPEWRGKPVVVGAPPDRRGVVAACSYEARKCGIRSAMPSREAGRLCPHAVFVPPNMQRYAAVSREVFAIFERFTPLIEPLSIDEAFLDVTGARRLFGDGPRIAALIKEAVRRETELTASVGVAPNMFLAKLCSEMGKPDGLKVAPDTDEEIRRFLAPLPVGRLWGVGPVTAQRLQSARLCTIGDLQSASADRLAGLLGTSAARHIRQLAFGHDAREVETDRREKSISREHTFDEDCRDADVLEETLCELVEDVGAQLRAAGLSASVVRLKLRWQGFVTITRQKALPQPVFDDYTLRAEALALFRAEPLAGPVRLIGVGVSRLSAGAGVQLSFLDGDSPGRERREKLSRAVDTVRQRFGSAAIGRARSGPARRDRGPDRPQSN